MDNLGWNSEVTMLWSNNNNTNSNQYDNFLDSDQLEDCGRFELGGSFTDLDYYSSVDLEHLLFDRQLSDFNATDECARRELSSSNNDGAVLQNCSTVAVASSNNDESIVRDSSTLFKNDDTVLYSSSCHLSSSGESECSESSKTRPEKNHKRKLDVERGSNSGGFQIFFERSKRTKLDKKSAFTNIDFRGEGRKYEADTEAIAQVKEMIYRAAALRPVNFGMDEVTERPRRKNVRISSDPQTVAARHRRERISERLRVLQSLVPGGAKMDTASMLDEAASYLKFLKAQVSALETLGSSHSSPFPMHPKP